MLPFSTAGRRAALPLLLAALAAAFPRTTEGARARAPAVTLDALRLGPDAATAPVVGGGTATLTLDPALQRAAQKLLADARPRQGSVVAVDPRTGQVLAWAGVRGSSRAASVVRTSLAPAASLFKIVTTAALLRKFVSPDRPVCTSGGGAWIGEDHLSRPAAGQALCAPFREALGRSRNAAFAQLATHFLRKEDLTHAAERLGFGQDAPFDVPIPVGSLDVPEGDLGLARAAAGFVGSRLSPIGAAHLATTIAAGGRVVRLHIVREADGFRLSRRRETVSRALSEGAAREIARMMEVTIHSGTSRAAFSDADGQSVLGDIRVAGKTGTLQASATEPLTSWFIGFAPSRAPRIVVSVLLENGPGWRERANEIGRDVLRTYFAARGARGVTAPGEG